jgi:hypothetical protein
MSADMEKFHFQWTNFWGAGQKFSQQSISDWKNAYHDVCNDCTVRDRCGGFFQWNTKLQSRGIHAISN